MAFMRRERTTVAVWGSSWNVPGMSDEPSGTRLRRTVRLDEGGFNALCRIADAYWDGKRHSAADAALVDALCPPTPIPTSTSPPSDVSSAGNGTHLRQLHGDGAYAVARKHFIVVT